MTETQRTQPVFRPAAFRVACAALALPLLALCGCVYRMPIRQGNYLDPATIAQVKPGMTRSQVRYLLGSPMVPDAFDADRWDYGFYLKSRRLQNPRQAHATVYFKNNVVERVDSDVKTVVPIVQ